jgi:hypothetical protein
MAALRSFLPTVTLAGGGILIGRGSTPLMGMLSFGWPKGQALHAASPHYATAAIAKRLSQHDVMVTSQRPIFRCHPRSNSH